MPPTTSAPFPAGTMAPQEVPGLDVEIRQSRSHWGARVVQLRVVSRSAEAFVVTAGRLRTPTADGVAATDPGWERRVPAGRTRDASVPLGEPRCPAPAGGGPVVELDLADEAGRTATVTVVPTDPQEHLARIHGEDCAALAVSEGVTLAFEADLPVAGDGEDSVATPVLVLEPVDGGPPVTLDRVDGTVLFGPAGGGSGWDVVLGPVTGRTEVPLALTPNRCDAHAVAEDKRGTFFGVRATVDGQPQPVFYVHAGQELAGALHDFVALHCEW